MRSPRASVAAVVAACLALPLLGYVAAQPAASAAPGPEDRIAFTDGRSELVSMTESSGEFDTFWWPTDLSGTTEYEGQASVARGEGRFGYVAYVSTENPDPEDPDSADDPDGEVHVAELSGDSTTEIIGAEQVTCDNDATEMHPQVMDGGWTVVYASDIDGDFEIYMAERADDAGQAAAGGGCAGWDITQLTDDDADDLWPTVPIDLGSETILAYSSTRDDPLGDIRTLRITPDGQIIDQRWTDGPAAETQPALVWLGDYWIVFTTTQFRSDRRQSLAVVPFGRSAAPVSLWRNMQGDPPEASEAAISSDVRGEGSLITDLAYTTTGDDPGGDVHGYQISVPPSSDETEDRAPRATDFRFDIAVDPLFGESHPAWRAGLDAGWPAEVVITRRVEERDISDARALDGSDRRGLISTEDRGEGVVQLDDAGPSYSPDGERMAFSTGLMSSLWAYAPGLMIANADGSEPESLDPVTGRELDIDTDPVFSPDGTKIAFTRYPYQGEGWGDPEVWVVENFDDEESADAYRLTRDPGEFTYAADTQPSWSPDGRFVVVSRQYTSSASTEPPRLVVLEAEGVEEDEEVRYADLIVGPEERPAEGSAPAWSPDGANIVFENGGALWLLRVDPAVLSDTLPDHVWPVERVRAVTGFREADSSDPFAISERPTPSRGRISTAYDPAWSPNGTEIAFTGQPAGHADRPGIWAVAPDGTGLRRIADEPGPEGEPAWRPTDGTDLEVDVTVTGSPAAPGDPIQVEFTVTNLGPAAATGVTLTTGFTDGAVVAVTDPPAGCAADGTGCEIPTLGPGGVLRYAVAISHDRGTNGKATGEVTSTSYDPVPDNNRFVAPYLVTGTAPGADLAVGIEFGAEIGYVGGTLPTTITVTNRGPQPADAVLLRMRYPALVEHTAEAPLPCSPVEEGVTAPATDPEDDDDGGGGLARVPVDPPQPELSEIIAAEDGRCDLGSIGPGQSQVLEVELPLLTDGEAMLRARTVSETPEDNPTDNLVEAPFEVVAPTIRLLPAVARPGMVVLAYGENMPPGDEVTLEWDLGITVDRRPRTVAEDGTLRASLLVVRKDRLGPRQLVATSTTESFEPLTGDLLVALRLMAGPELLGRG